MNVGQIRVSPECPICRSRDSEFVHREISNVDAARHFLNPTRDKDRYEALCRHIAELWDRDYCSIRKCRDCGFGFSDPYIAGDEKFYSLAYDHKPGDYPTQKWEYKVAKDMLKMRIAAHGEAAARLMEIGAGDGAFLRQIVPELIPPERVFCTEYGEYAATQIRNLGIRVAQGDIREMDLRNEKPFDIVCMFQVLEHMDRLTELFSTLRTSTSPKADLLIAVPNSKRTEFSEHNGALLDMPPNHIGRWSKLSFEALAKREGWEVVQYIEQPTDSKESWQTFSYYRYARAAQFDNSASARIRGLRRTAFSRTLEYAMVAAFAIRSVPLLPTLFSEGMGGAVLVNLRRQI
jgi:SAM-dependent methyltransferase